MQVLLCSRDTLQYCSLIWHEKLVAIDMGVLKVVFLTLQDADHATLLDQETDQITHPDDSHRLPDLGVYFEEQINSL